MATKADQMKVLQAIYARILMFAFLTRSKVETLADIIKCASNEENERILSNLELGTNILESIQSRAATATLVALNSKIFVNNLHLNDGELQPEEKRRVIDTKFQGAAHGMMLKSSEGLMFEKDNALRRCE